MWWEKGSLAIIIVGITAAGTWLVNYYSVKNQNLFVAYRDSVSRANDAFIASEKQRHDDSINAMDQRDIHERGGLERRQQRELDSISRRQQLNGLDGARAEIQMSINTQAELFERLDEIRNEIRKQIERRLLLVSLSGHK